MKTNFTLFAKFISVAVLLLACTTVPAHNNNSSFSTISENLKVTIVNNNLVMNWSLTNTTSVNYCEIQGSEDGKTFKTIGYVMGADPLHDNNYSFKQAISKMKPGKTYFRVLIIGMDEKATSSEIVKISQ